MAKGWALQLTKDSFELIIDCNEQIVNLGDSISLYKKNKYRFLLLSFSSENCDNDQTTGFLYKIVDLAINSISTEKVGFIPDLEQDDVNLLLSYSDFVKGGRFLNEKWINKNFENIVSEIYSLSNDKDTSIYNTLTELKPKIIIPSKMYFHLVENYNAEGKPFAFMVTFTLSIDKDTKHYPIRNVLSSKFRNAKQTDTILNIIETLSNQSPFMSAMIKNGNFFKPTLIDEKEAYGFLQEINLYEKMGIVCRVPKWRSAASKISIDIDERKYYQPAVFIHDRIILNNLTLFYKGVEITVEEAKEILKKSEGLEKIKGKWVEIDHKEIEKLLSEYKQLSGQGVTFKELLIKNTSYKKEDMVTNVEISNSDWISMLTSSMFKKNNNAVIPNDLLPILRPYQKDAFYWLASMKTMGLGACLADDMGLGKTLEIISFLSYLYSLNKGPILIIVPATLVSNWLSEINRFSPYLDCTVLHNYDSPTSGEVRAFITIATYQSASKSEYLKTVQWEEIILDEAQAIKNYYTNQTKAIKLLNGNHKIALTGTPMENNILELWSIFDFLNPGYLGTRKEFIDFVAGEKMVLINPNELKVLITPFILRRMKTDKNIIEELPEKREINIKINLTPKQIVLYKKELENYKEMYDKAKDKSTQRGLTLVELMKLKQICNHPSQYLGDDEYYVEDSGKFIELKSLCENIAIKQEKVLVFTQYKEIIPALEMMLNKVFGKTGNHIDGSVSPTKRHNIVQDFQNGEYPFLIISLKTGGVGITLTEANNVVHFDRWWNPAVENQATDRAYRIGQEKNVFVYKFTSSGTIEDLIDQSIDIKTDLVDKIVNSIDHNETLNLSGDELYNLLKYRGFEND